MSGNTFGTDDLEKTFEQGISTVKKTAGSVVKQTAQQAQATKKTFIDQLYGVKDDAAKESGSGNNSQNVVNQQLAKPDIPSDLTQFPGLTSPQDIARYHQIQNQLKGQQGGSGDPSQKAKAQSTHNQNYFRKDIGTLEDQIDRESQKKIQIEKEKLQAEKQQEIERQQADKAADQEFTAPQGKAKEGASRNRMGKKTNSIVVTRAERKAEMFRGASG